jgi:hypothetical protein
LPNCGNILATEIIYGYRVLVTAYFINYIREANMSNSGKLQLKCKCFECNSCGQQKLEYLCFDQY